MKKILVSLILAGALASCDIERLPYGSYTEEGISQDKEAAFNILLNGCYAKMKAWADEMHRLGEYSGDNVAIRGFSTDDFFDFISFNHRADNGRMSVFWSNSYNIISQTSDVIKMAQEGESTKIDQQLGEAYYMRGMMYFYLCRAFGRPYYDSPETNLGVPIANGMPDDLDNLKLPNRSTVKETYAQAIRDLQKAEKLMTENKPAIYGTQAAAQALLSRIYLYMGGTWENSNTVYNDSCIYYANQVLANPKYELLSRDKFLRYNTYAPDDAEQKETIFAIKRVSAEYSGYDYYYNIGGMYSNIDGMGWGEMYASEKYLNLLRKSGKSDARWTFIDPQYLEDKKGDKIPTFRFVVPLKSFVKDGPIGYEKGTLIGYKYIQANSILPGNQVVIKEQIGAKSGVDDKGKPISVPIWEENTYQLTEWTSPTGDTYYKVNFYGTEYTGEMDYEMILNYSNPMYYIYKCSKQNNESQLHSPIISRLAEMYLNLAEAYAKKGLYGDALTNLNYVRERANPTNPIPSLDATNAAQLIEEERQLELAFEAQRGFDIFRNAKTLTRFYPGGHDMLLEIPATHKRVVQYIPQREINAYPGPLTQNP